jgi:hypothetical protein
LGDRLDAITISGVAFALSAASISAPASRSSVTICALLAWCSAVERYRSVARTFAPRASRILAMSHHALGASSASDAIWNRSASAAISRHEAP